MTCCLILFGRAPRSGRMVACTQALAVAYCLEALLTLLLLLDRQNSFSTVPLVVHVGTLLNNSIHKPAPQGPSLQRSPEFQQVCFDKFLPTDWFTDCFTETIGQKLHLRRYGVFQWSDGRRYIGQFQAGEMTGERLIDADMLHSKLKLESICSLCLCSCFSICLRMR